MTKEIAEQFVADEDSVDLIKFAAIADIAAESLSKHDGMLELGGLTILSVDNLPASAAQILRDAGHG